MKGPKRKQGASSTLKRQVAPRVLNPAQRIILRTTNGIFRAEVHVDSPLARAQRGRCATTGASSSAAESARGKKRGKCSIIQTLLDCARKRNATHAPRAYRVALPGNPHSARPRERSGGPTAGPRQTLTRRRRATCHQPAQGARPTPPLAMTHHEFMALCRPTEEAMAGQGRQRRQWRAATQRTPEETGEVVGVGRAPWAGW